MNREEIYRQFEELDKRASLGGGVDKIEKQHASGRMTARERIDMLLDKGSFNELDKFVNHRCTNFGMEKKQIAGDGMVSGYGKIDGRLVFVYAYDFTAHGGSLSETNAAKIVKVQQLALKNGAPVIALNDSGGARIQEGVNSLAGYASIFYQNTIASGVIPQISAILGPCAGGACYSTALTDFIFMVKEQSHMFITGPDVVKTVTHEEVDKEELGGAYTHSSKSGVTHFMCNTEEETLMSIRELLSFLPSNNMEDAPFTPCSDDIHRRVEALQTVIPEDPNMPYDIKDIIEPVLDNQYFFEVMPHFAKNVVIGFGRLNGRSVGIVANQPAYLAGVLDIDASDKAARFIRFCDCFNIPLITFEDVPGFLPGTMQEHNGIIRKAMDALGQGFNGKTFQNLHQALLNVDQYMALADFASYSHAQQKAEQLYKDQTKWNSMSLVNTAKAGIFAADRAIRDYANTIWLAKPVETKAETKKK